MTRILFIHGRAQEGRTALELKAEWLLALNKGLSAIEKPAVAAKLVDVPFYGDLLHELSTASVPDADELKRSGQSNWQDDDYTKFMTEAAIEIFANSAIKEAPLPSLSEDDPDVSLRSIRKLSPLPLNQTDIDDLAQRGLQNWPWVIAAVRRIDETFPAVSSWSMGKLLRDVYIYLSDVETREKIDKIVEEAIGTGPTLVVAHSLGTVVAYNVLRKKKRNISGLITLGSPLAIRAISKRLEPPKIIRPSVGPWVNIYDKQDIVALNPLHSAAFADFKPAIADFEMHNNSDNRHNIKPYLSNAITAEKIDKVLRSGNPL